MYSLLRVILLGCVLFNPGVAVPMMQKGCGSDTRVLANGEQLELTCGCNNHGDWVWLYSDGGGESNLDTATANLVIDQVNYTDGGQYTCKCVAREEQCIYNIVVLPTVILTASASAVHYHGLLELSCVVVGSPTNHSTIQSISGSAIAGQRQRPIDSHTTQTYAVIDKTEDGEFLCVAEIYVQHRLIARVEETLLVTVYRAPVIIYTTQYTVQGEQDFNRPGQLTCAIETSGECDALVQWWFNGTEITDCDKYSIQSTHQDTVVQHKLTVNSLQHWDIGSYLCQLSSQHAVEDSQDAWIQVDYRANTKRPQHRPIADNPPKGGLWLLCCVCGLCLLIAASWFSCRGPADVRLPHHKTKSTTLHHTSLKQPPATLTRRKV